MWSAKQLKRLPGIKSIRSPSRKTRSGRTSTRNTFKIKNSSQPSSKTLLPKQRRVRIRPFLRQTLHVRSLLAKGPSDSDTESSAATTVKKTKEFRVLDPRAGQNFGEILVVSLTLFILRRCSLLAIMFSQLKSSPQQFRQWLLACDGQHLTSDLLAQLDKSLPTAEELKKLSELKNEINDLPDSEQYFCAVSLTSLDAILVYSRRLLGLG